MQEQEIVDTLVEIDILEEDNFLKIKETLTRIGVPSYRTSTLFQSCHILHKKGKYYICHFKELFKLDGRPTNLSREDIQRRNSIANLVQSWKLCKIVNDNILDSKDTQSRLKIVKFHEKKDWNLEAKYTIGGRI
ncbi:MAG: translational repressor RegA [Candidatus Izemoplasma sp.]